MNFLSDICPKSMVFSQSICEVQKTSDPWVVPWVVPWVDMATKTQPKALARAKDLRPMRQMAPMAPMAPMVQMAQYILGFYMGFSAIGHPWTIHGLANGDETRAEGSSQSEGFTAVWHQMAINGSKMAPFLTNTY